MLRALFPLFLLLGFGQGLALADTAIQFTQVNTLEDWQATVARAQEQQKLLFVDVYTDWCGYCKMMDRDVFADPAVGERFNASFVNVKLDAETAFGEQFAIRYGVSGYPTYLFLDGGQQSVGVIEGYVETEPFLQQTDQIVAVAERLPNLMTKWEAGELSRSEKRQLAILLYGQDPLKARRLAQEEVEVFTLAEVKDPENLSFLLEFGYDLKGPIWALIKENPKSVRDGLGTDNFDRYLGRVYNGGLASALTQQDESYLKAVLNEVLPIYLQDLGEMAEATFITRKIYYGHAAEAETYNQLVEDYYAKAGQTNPDYWYNEAFEVIEEYNEGTMLSLVFPWLDRYLESKPQDFDGLTLYSYALGMSGNFDGAKEKAEAALAVAETEDQKAMARDMLDMVAQAQGGQ